jgi:hypothetical protein
MRIILKIIAATFVVILSVLWAVSVFLFGALSGILGFICGIGVLLSIIFFIAGLTPGGIILLVFSFLISPVGLPLIAEWLIGKLSDLNEGLKDFITT